MKRIVRVFLLTAGVMVMGVTAIAQTTNPTQTNTAGDSGAGEADGVKGFWECQTSNGRFVARLDQISSVSEHQYVIDGAVRVFECTVDCRGSVVARFYYIEPITAQGSSVPGSQTLSTLKNIANRAGSATGAGNVDTTVIKNYPTTTHSKTSEYRVANKATISQIYEHVHRVWAQERGNGRKNKLVIN